MSNKLTKVLLRPVSKYKKLDQVMSKVVKKSDIMVAEPIITLQPKSRSVYEAQSSIEPFKFPAYQITPEKEIPSFMFDKQQESTITKIKEQPENPRLARVAIWGPTNSGKSSLFNKLIGREISAVSNKSFTTDETITGVVTDFETRSQLILYDLPGFASSAHPRDKANIDNTVKKVLQEEGINFILFMVDCNKHVDKGYRKSFEILESASGPDVSIFLVMNKMDLCFNRRRLGDIVSEYEGLFNFVKKFYISTETGFVVNDLLSYLQQQAPPGEWVYPPQIKTPMSEIDIAHEVIKSSIYQRFFKEFPYHLHYEIVEFSVTNEAVKIVVQLKCERKIHIRIIVGKDGKNMESLQHYIQKRLCQVYAREVQLELIVNKGRMNAPQKLIVDDADVKEKIIQEMKAVEEGTDVVKILRGNK